MASAGLSFYSNMAFGPAYFDFFTAELPRLVRRYFPISDKREDNFVAGTSMGGYGALKLGLSRPDMYSAIGSFSLGAFMHGDTTAMANYPELMMLIKMVFGVDGASELIGTEHDPIALAEKAIASGVQLPRIYHICGTDDHPSILSTARTTRDLLQKRAIDYTYHEGPGGHTWDFWDEWIQKFLAWLYQV